MMMEFNLPDTVPDPLLALALAYEAAAIAALRGMFCGVDGELADAGVESH